MRRVRAAAAVVFGLVGCGGVSAVPPAKPTETVPAPSAAARLSCDPVRDGIAEQPELIARMKKSPHSYFRFINVRFADAVCERVAADMADFPIVNLHGDPHIEQYAVTDYGRGLTDFDDSSVGPAALDLVRFGVSVHLALRELGAAPGQGRRLINDMFRGYQAALESPDVVAPEPAFAKRTRKAFHHNAETFLAEVEGLMNGVTPQVAQAFETAAKPYAEVMREQSPELSESFFHVKRVGRLKVGIGSALSAKYLLRVEGPAAIADDDIILEAKEVRDLSGIRCIRSGPRHDAFRIIVGKSRIGTEPHPYLGYLRAMDHTFWIHAWTVNYQELVIPEIKSASELAEIAFEVGVQLGRGHPKQVASPLDLQLRKELISALGRHREEIHTVCEDLTRETLDAWESFPDGG